MELTRKNILIGLTVLAGAAAGWAYWAKAAADPWSGFYVGVAGGYSGAVLEDTLGAEGPSLAGIVGYDTRLGRFVPGVFAEYGYKTFDWAGFGGVDVDVTSWVAGGRLGFLASDTALLFVSAGYTQGEADIATAWGEDSVDLTGYVVGAGADLYLGQGFFLRPEYRLTKYNEIDDDEADASVHEGRLAVTYKFNWADPLARDVPLK